MKVSIIIPFYNEESVLKDCLSTLVNQTSKELEIILVDDGSTDNSKQVIEDIAHTSNRKIIVLSQNHQGPGAARNLAAKKATGEILVFVDADMTFEKNFIKNLVRPIIGGKIKGTFSKYEYVANWNNVWAKCWNINQGWEDKRRHPRNYPDTQKVFRAIDKKEFDRVGGFIPGGYMDDYSLSNKLGYDAVGVKGAFFYHNNPESLAEVFKQAKWSGKREYKLGFVGKIIALVRSSLPVSFIVGLIKSIYKKTPQFIIFKLVYDFGIIVGIIESSFFNKLSK